MIQLIRDKAQGWLLWAIILILVLSFVFWGAQRNNFGSGSGGAKVVAKVNGQEINQSQFDVALQRFQQSNAAAQVQGEPSKVIKEAVLNQMIRTIALAQYVSQQGYRISNAQLQALLAAIPVFQDNGHFSKERFDTILQRMGFSEEDFIRQVQQDMSITQQQTGVTMTAFVLPDELKQIAGLVNQQRSFTYLIFPYQTFLKQVQVNQNEISQYYQQHQNDFANPEQISISYIKLSAADLNKQITVSPADVANEYQENIDTYTKPQQWQIAHILLKADDQTSATKINSALKANPKDFAKLAEQYSSDIITAKKGGVLPWFSPGMMDKSIENSLMNLKVGQYAGPIATANGLEFIQLLAEKPSSKIPFAQVKDQIKSQMINDKSSKLFADLSEQLSNLTYANPNSLDSTAKQLNLKVETTEMFSRDNNQNKDLTANPKIIAAAFSGDVLAGNNSDMIDLDNQTRVVLRMLQHKPASVKPLSEVQNTIKTLIATNKAKDLAKFEAQQLLKTAKNLVDIEHYAKDHHLKFTTENEVKRSDKTIDADILKNAFNLRMASDLSSASDIFELNNGNTVLLSLNHIGSDASASIGTDQMTNLKKALETSFGQQEYQMLVEQVIRQSKIKRSEDFK